MLDKHPQFAYVHLTFPTFGILTNADLTSCALWRREGKAARWASMGCSSYSPPSLEGCFEKRRSQNKKKARAETRKGASIRCHAVGGGWQISDMEQESQNRLAMEGRRKSSARMDTASRRTRER
uniref:Uncharacterized protein n=2 Tax=Anthoceros TaxID=3233 RepID=A0A6M8AYH1_ANTPU|nr:hypothetical protein [Anthoceros punctatus]YP_009863191.1 hypothetical protein [Anthoceros agrestis]QKD76605.1 hypothetical protein [Anthoceros punctatus]QKD76647.1 hypothetical protein [Anthoceros agrestis]